MTGARWPGSLPFLKGLSPEVLAVQLQQVEGIEEDMAALPLLPRSSNITAKPFSSQATASPSIRQDRTLRAFTPSTMSGYRGASGRSLLARREREPDVRVRFTSGS